MMVACVTSGANVQPSGCAPFIIPAGQCWHDAEHVIGRLSDVSPSRCCDLCHNASECMLWVWYQGASASSGCNLYTAPAPTQSCTQQIDYVAGWNSSVAPPTPPPTPPTPPTPPPPYVPPYPTPKGAKDVIMIAVDDMRPELGCYDCSHMQTPNMDALAAESLIFDNAYVAVAWCSPSRTALLTSRHPDTTRTWSVVPSEYWRIRGGNFTTLPQYFKERGYLTMAVGKIFHPGPASGNNDEQYSWSAESLPYSQSGNAADCINAQSSGEVDNHEGGAAMEPGPGPDNNIPCTVNATLTRIGLQRKNESDLRPLFYAAGFHKPHIPWNVPQSYFDKYPLESIALAANINPPKDVPTVAMNNILSGYWSDSFSDFAALRANGTISKVNPADNSTLDPYWQRRARQAYWAAISYTDHNVGVVVEAAKRNGLYDNSIVLLWGDHGYQIGENDQWSKVSNFEQSVRIPLLVRVPGSQMNGKRTSALWEAIDLMPTLTDLAMGQTPPTCPNELNGSRAIELCTDGKSAAPLFRPTTNASQWKSHAISQVPRGALVNGEPGNVAGEIYMGYSVRVPSWRFTEWVKFDPDTGIADWDAVVGRELYPESLGKSCLFDTDNVNMASDPSKAIIVKELLALVRSTV